MQFSALPSFCLFLSLAATLALGAEHVGNAFGGSSVNPDRIYLPGLVKLSFVAHTYTTPRRTVPRPQLTCIGGDASDRTDLYPSRVDCYNAGVDPDANGQPIPKWECVGAIDRSVLIDEWTVNCEGWSFEGDLYVVKGSCWLQYRLSFSHDGSPPAAVDNVSNGANATSGLSVLQWLLHLSWNIVLLVVVVSTIAFCFFRPENPLSAEREPLVNAQQNYAATSET